MLKSNKISMMQQIIYDFQDGCDEKETIWNRIYKQNKDRLFGLSESMDDALHECVYAAQNVGFVQGMEYALHIANMVDHGENKKLLENLLTILNSQVGAEWVEVDGKTICSKCHYENENANIPYSFAFCPQCGSMMMNKQELTVTDIYPSSSFVGSLYSFAENYSNAKRKLLISRNIDVIENSKHDEYESLILKDAIRFSEENSIMVNDENDLIKNVLSDMKFKEYLKNDNELKSVMANEYYPPDTIESVIHVLQGLFYRRKI